MNHLIYSLCLSGGSVHSGILGIAATRINPDRTYSRWWSIDLSECEKLGMEFTAGAFYSFAGFSSEVIDLVKAKAGRLSTALGELSAMAEGVDHLWASTSYVAETSDHAILVNAYRVSKLRHRFPIKEMHNIETLYAMGYPRHACANINDPRDCVAAMVLAVNQAFNLSAPPLPKLPMAGALPQLPPL